MGEYWALSTEQVRGLCDNCHPDICHPPIFSHIIFKFEYQKNKLEVVMDVVVEEVVDKEVTKVVEQVNKE